MKRYWFILTVSMLLALVAAPAAAQSKSVEVPRRDAEITILPNGDVQVVETWEVKFKGGPFTTAYRSIPLNKVDRIDGWSVADGEHQYRRLDKGSSKDPYTFEYTSGDGQMKATWFFPATTDQTRTFKVGYTLHGALRIDAAGDEFYWKFIEADRAYPIQASRVVMHMPQGFKTDQLKATTYRSGAENAGARVVDERTIEFTGKSFPGGTEWEIRARFPHGIVVAKPSIWQTAPPTSNQPISPTPATSADLPNPWLIGVLVLLFPIIMMAVTEFLGKRGSAGSGDSGGDFGGGGDSGGGGSDGGGGGSSGFD